MIQIILSCFLEEVQFVHNRDRTKVVGAINYKISNSVDQHHHRVIYKMFSGKSSNPILIHRETPLGFITYVYIFMLQTLKAVENEIKDETFRSSFLSLLRGVLISMVIMSPLLSPCQATLRRLKIFVSSLNYHMKSQNLL